MRSVSLVLAAEAHERVTLPHVGRGELRVCGDGACGITERRIERPRVVRERIAQRARTGETHERVGVCGIELDRCFEVLISALHGDAVRAARHPEASA